jgi:hypothetical protein
MESLGEHYMERTTRTGGFASIEVFDNRQHCHAANDDLAPLAHEQVLNINASLGPEQC